MTPTQPAQPAWARARVLRAEKGHETQTLLVETAAQVFAESGYDRTTVADITQAAEVSRPTLYAYYSSKGEIFAEVAARTRDEFLAAHEIPGIDESDPRALGRASSAAFLAAYAANNDLLAVIEHRAISDPAIAAIWAEIQQRPMRRVARYIRRLTDEKAANPPAPAEVVAEAIIGIFARAGRSAPADQVGFDTLVDQLTEIYLRLLGIDETQGSDRRNSGISGTG